MPVKPLSFKGDKKTKKRKHRSHEADDGDNRTLVSTSQPAAEGGHDPSTDDDSWNVPDLPSDLTGPTLIVLPTTPPTCLAADAHGNVFASAIENMVDDYAETAEPHDVRQVWVVSSVAGTGTVNFKASHGGFLSCDSIGVLGARREARGAEEGFGLEAFEDGNGRGDGRLRWRLRTFASKIGDAEKGSRYISAVTDETSAGDDDAKDNKKKISISLRGDGEADSQSSHLVVKMQARFKPRVRQNKETKAKEKISRHELEQAVGRRLEDDEVKRLKRARKDGTYYEEILDVRVKGKHDKYAS